MQVAPAPGPQQWYWLTSLAADALDHIGGIDCKIEMGMDGERGKGGRGGGIMNIGTKALSWRGSEEC